MFIPKQNQITKLTNSTLKRPQTFVRVQSEIQTSKDIYLKVRKGVQFDEIIDKQYWQTVGYVAYRLNYYLFIRNFRLALEKDILCLKICLNRGNNVSEFTKLIK